MSNKNLLEHENNFATSMGAAFVGERVVLWGRDLHHDPKLKHASWFEVFLYSITGGRFFSKAEVKLLNAIWAYTGYPEPRLWNNRIAALAATTRSTKTAGIAAAIFASAATLYGHRPDTRSFDFLKRAKKAIDQGENLRSFVKKEIRTYRVLFGYGRPINNAVDERIPPLLELMEQLDIEKGKYFKLATEVENILPGQRMNVAVLSAAITADLNFSINEYTSFVMFVFSGGMLPCYTESIKKPTGAFFPLRSSCIEYQGVERRKW